MSEIYSDDASLGQYLQINKPHKKMKDDHSNRCRKNKDLIKASTNL